MSEFPHNQNKVFIQPPSNYPRVCVCTSEGCDFGESRDNCPLVKPLQNLDRVECMDVRFRNRGYSDPDVAGGVLVLGQDLEIGPLFRFLGTGVIYFFS